MNVTEISPEQALEQPAGTAFIDIRRPDEVSGLSAKSAILIPRDMLEIEIAKRQIDKTHPVVVMCQSGVRSKYAAHALQALGYQDAVSLAGGFNAWLNQGLETQLTPYLAPDEMDRYARHLSLDEIGTAGQARLKAATVGLIGAGGLGSPAALYLAAMGIGKLVIFDPDVVESSNLQRQILHSEEAVGDAKVDSARKRIEALNPKCTVETHFKRADATQKDILAQCHVILNGADNFAARHALNDICLELDIPLVDGAVLEMEGQVSVFNHDGGPCYRCLYPTTPPTHLAPSCAEAGVLGVVPGVIGVLQALEVAKLIAGFGEPLSGRLLCFNANSAEFSSFSFAKQPDCPSCGHLAAAQRSTAA